MKKRIATVFAGVVAAGALGLVAPPAAHAGPPAVKDCAGESDVPIVEPAMIGIFLDGDQQQEDLCI